jgi:RNA 2',3'-cyclic 3'-phosphodiesterase
MIRTFIALHIPDDIKDTLQKGITRLKEKNRSVKWVRPEGMHITLKFLGDIPEDLVGPLSEELDRAALPHPMLTLELSSFGAFPNVKRPRVVWAGLKGDVEGLAGLAVSVDKACARCGISEERRPFSAHITLGRLKAPTMVDLDTGSLAGVFTAREVLLYRSELLPEGAWYTVLHRSCIG